MNMKITDINLTAREVERVLNSVPDDKFMELFENLSNTDDFLVRMNGILLKLVSILYNSASIGLPEQISVERIYKISERIIEPMVESGDCIIIELLIAGLIALSTFSEMTRLAVKGGLGEDESKGVEENIGGS